jgi:hypothetical protein
MISLLPEQSKESNSNACYSIAIQPHFASEKGTNRHRYVVEKLSVAKLVFNHPMSISRKNNGIFRHVMSAGFDKYHWLDLWIVVLRGYRGWTCGFSLKA